MTVHHPRLVILGFDAGDPDLLQRWAQEGYLPTIASIMKQGCHGRTDGPEFISEDRSGIWISLFSGVSRAQHGYYYFRQLKPSTYDLQPFTGRDARALPFWACLCGRNKKVAVIDAPEVYPLTGLSGIQLANWATHPHNPPFAPSAEPAELLQVVRRVFGSQMRIAEKFNSSFRQDWQIYRRLLESVERKGALCRHLLARDLFDLIVVVFSESHMAGHQFWKYRPEGLVTGTATAEDELTHAIRDIYQAIDRQMGLLLAQLPGEANVFVVSSTGMEDCYPTTGLIEAFCRQLGYHAPPEPGRASLRPMALIRRIVPESWRIALSRYLPRETRERLLAEQFRSGTNWRKTTAFAIPSFYISFVRVNLRGREPQGIVEPGADYEVLLHRLEAGLKQLIDPLTGEPAVKQVARTVDVFHCGPPAFLPDLFIEWKGSHFLQRVVHPRTDLIQQKSEFFRSNDHSNNGFVAAAGPFIQGRGPIGDVSLLDLAPTFLCLMGEPFPERMTGQVIRAMIHP